MATMEAADGGKWKDVKKLLEKPNPERIVNCLDKVRAPEPTLGPVPLEMWLPVQPVPLPSTQCSIRVKIFGWVARALTRMLPLFLCARMALHPSTGLLAKDKWRS